jgi:hypothetical protein
VSNRLDDATLALLLEEKKRHQRIRAFPMEPPTSIYR